jgi:hypothetical protein
VAKHRGIARWHAGACRVAGAIGSVGEAAARQTGWLAHGHRSRHIAAPGVTACQGSGHRRHEGGVEHATGADGGSHALARRRSLAALCARTAVVVEEPTVAKDIERPDSIADPDARLVYESLRAFYAHEEQERWSSLYNYLMATTIRRCPADC